MNEGKYIPTPQTVLAFIRGADLYYRGEGRAAVYDLPYLIGQMDQTRAASEGWEFAERLERLARRQGQRRLT